MYIKRLNTDLEEDALLTMIDCLSPLKLSHYDGANGRVLGWLGSGIRMRTA